MKVIKKLLFGLLFGLFGLVNFSNAGSFIYSGHFDGVQSNSRSLFAFPTYLNSVPYSGYVYVYCSFSNYNSNLTSITLQASTPGITSVGGQTTAIVSDPFIIPNDNILSFELYKSTTVGKRVLGGVNFTTVGTISENVSFDWSCVVSGTAVLDIPVCQECEICPEVNTGEILSGYVSESLLNECILDLNSCNSYSSGFNNLLNSCNNELNSCNSSLTSCLQYNCPTSGTGDIVWSNLYINDILHIGSPSIFLNIPEEFNWNYSYSTGYMIVDIEGYNVDSDYIEGIINIQNSKPSQGDLNKLVSEVLPLFVPGLIVILFLYFIFRFIKKVF